MPHDRTDVTRDCIACRVSFVARAAVAGVKAYCSETCRASWHRKQLSHRRLAHRVGRQRYVVHELARAGVFRVPMTQTEVAALLGISRQRVDQIEAKALAKLGTHKVAMEMWALRGEGE